jgi:hypothetical protein
MKMKKSIYLFLFTLLLWAIPIISFCNTTDINHDEIILEIYNKGEHNFVSFMNIFQDDDALPYEFRGTTNINGEIITFGLFNTDKIKSSVFLKRIDDQISNLVNSATSNKDSTQISENIEKAKQSLKITSLSFIDTKSQIEKTQKKITDINNTMALLDNDKFGIKTISKIERENFLKSMQKSKDSIPNREINNAPVTGESFNDLKKYKENAKKIIEGKKQIKEKQYSSQNSIIKNLLSSLIAYTTLAKGGESFTDKSCDSGAWNPPNLYCGDKQDRLKQKRRFNGSDTVYSWIPTWVRSTTSNINTTTQERQFYLEFLWDATSLSNLVIDNNEAIEAQILFYNYGIGTGIPGNGKAWMSSFPPKYWATNLPSGYLDTRFFDNSGEKSFAV